MMPGLVARPSGLVRRQAFGQAFQPAEGVSPRILFAELARYSRELAPPQDLLKLAQRFGRNPWIYAAAFRKAADQAAIPLEVVEWQGDTAVPVSDAHPLQALLYRVNPFYTGEDLIELDSLYLDLTGNDFWLIFAGSDGQPAEIWPLMPHWVSIVKDPERYIAGYVVRPDGGDPHPFFPIASSPTGTGILHLKRANPWDLWWGQGPLAAAWASALTDEAAAEYRYWFYKNAARPDGILKTAQKLTEAGVRMIRESWASTFQGPSNAHRVAVLDSDLSYQPISVPPKDADVHKDRELSRPDQLVAFGVPLAALGIESGDVGRRDEQIRHYYRSTILPCLRKRGGTLTEFLAPRFGPHLEVRANLSGVKEFQEDEQRRATVDQILLQTGQRTINELRERDGLEAVAWGEKPLLPISLAPLGEGGFGLAGLSGGGLGGHKWWPGAELEDARGLLWDEIVEKAGPYERDFRRLVLGALLDAGQGVVGALRAGHTPPTAITEGLAGLPAALYAAALAVLPDVLDAAWLRALGLIRRARRETRQAKQAALEIAFDLAIPEIAAYLRQRPVRYGDQVAATLSEWFRGQLADLANEGASIDQMADAISTRFPEIAPARARLISRTEIVSASNLAMTTAYERSEVVEAREWLTARDERVRPSHAAADGQARGLKEPFSVGGARLRFPGDPDGPPGEIVNCFPPGSWMSGRFVAGLKSWYTGPLWQIKTGRGCRLTITPNHPILTPSGWVAAHRLCEGDYLIGDRSQLWPTPQGNPDDQHAPAPVDEIFETIATNGRRWAAMIGRLDLHGDAIFCEREVEVVALNGILPLYGHSPSDHATRNGFLPPALMRQAVIDRPGPSNSFVETVLPPSTGRPRLRQLPLDHRTIMVHSGPFQPLCIGPAAQRNILLSQSTVDDDAPDPEISGQGIDALAGHVPGGNGWSIKRKTLSAFLDSSSAEVSMQRRQTDLSLIRQLGDWGATLIALDQIIEIRQVEFSGHVYDLQTDIGWMIAEGIAVSNCRCVTLPILTQEEG